MISRYLLEFLLREIARVGIEGSKPPLERLSDPSRYPYLEG